MRIKSPYRTVTLLLSIIIAVLLAGCSINLDENGNIGISADETAPQPEKTAGVSENEPEAQAVWTE